MALVHGGQLSQVAQSFGLDSEGWLDLSTGISPFSYPVPHIPESVWRELPLQKDSLKQVAQKYYAARELLLTSGSQSVIQILPKVWEEKTSHKTSVLVPAIGYKEHEKAWRDSGFQVIQYHQLPSPEELKEQTILVVINPNNPSGEFIERERLKRLHTQLKLLDGWLIVDEAFIDIYPKHYSMMPFAHQQGIFVLRSIGKFFGLAGIRAGVVSCCSCTLKKIEAFLGPWQVNGPALFICEQALADIKWQRHQREKLASQTCLSKRLLLQTLKNVDSTNRTPIADPDSVITGTDLFLTIKHSQAEKIYQALCKQKIYVRLCDDRQAIRLGIPNNQDLERLVEGLLKAINELTTQYF